MIACIHAQIHATHSEDKAREVLGATDLNGDGAISYDEFKVRFQMVLSGLGVGLMCPIGWLVGWAGRPYYC